MDIFLVILYPTLVLGVAVLLFCIMFFAMKPATSDRQRRYKKRLDNMFTAQTFHETWRSLVTPADRYEASAQTRSFVAKIRAGERTGLEGD